MLDTFEKIRAQAQQMALQLTAELANLDQRIAEEQSRVEEKLRELKGQRTVLVTQINQFNQMTGVKPLVTGVEKGGSGYKLPRKPGEACVYVVERLNAGSEYQKSELADIARMDPKTESGSVYQMVKQLEGFGFVERVGHGIYRATGKQLEGQTVKSV